jgi:hypothetical protein
MRACRLSASIKPESRRAHGRLTAINQELTFNSGGNFDVAQSSVINRNGVHITLCRRSVVLCSLNSGEAKSQRAWRASFAAVLLRPLASETQALRMPLVRAAALLPFGRCALSRRNALVRRQKTQAVACRCYSFSRSSSLVAQALSHVRRRCFPSLRRAGILIAFISGEA